MRPNGTTGWVLRRRLGAWHTYAPRWRSTAGACAPSATRRPGDLERARRRRRSGRRRRPSGGSTSARRSATYAAIRSTGRGRSARAPTRACRSGPAGGWSASTGPTSPADARGARLTGACDYATPTSKTGAKAPSRDADLDTHLRLHPVSAKCDGAARSPIVGMATWQTSLRMAGVGVRPGEPADRAGRPTTTDTTRHVRRAHVPELHRHRGEPRPQQHPGEPAGPRGRHALQRRRCRSAPRSSRPSQPNCTPLPDWSFTMGKGYASRAVTGPWGALSVVTGPFAGDIVTKTSVPLLDRNGDDTGQTLAGAVTVPLTADQIALAAKANSLWAQGGTPTDPVLNGQYPGKLRLRRAALRRRRAERGQRRVDRLPHRREARLLLRLLRRPAADERHDRHPQGRGRPGCHRHAVVRLPGRHLLHVRPALRDRGVGRYAGLGDLLPRGGPDVVVARAGPSGVDAVRPGLHVEDGREPDADRCLHRRGLRRPRRRGHGHVHPHRSARAATVRPAAAPRSRAAGSGASTSTCPGPTTPPRPSRRPTRARRSRALS